jgi:hypothetical protein
MGRNGIASTLLIELSENDALIGIRLLDDLRMLLPILHWPYQFIAFYASISPTYSMALISK